jgi:hypothetical protein
VNTALQKAECKFVENTVCVQTCKDVTALSCGIHAQRASGDLLHCPASEQGREANEL